MRCKPDKISGLILALIVGVFFCAPVQVWGGTQVINIQLAGSENDAEEDSGGTVTLTEATLDLGGWNHIVGLRFTNVAVPKNAAITNAYIEFTTDGQDSGSTSFTIEGIASDNAAGFTDSSFDLSSKPVFSTPVEWDVNFDWLTLDAVHQGPNISAIIQKLVDRDGWVSGNAMAFKISGIEEIYRRAKSYDQTSDSAPTLHIEYTANVFEARVSSSTDDAYETFLGMPTIDLYDDDLTITYGQFVGLRFNGITIPQGSVINYAHIEFVSSGNNADVGKIKIRGHAHDNAPTFTTSYHNIYNRHLTTATSEYLFWSSIPAWTAGEHYISADISNIVQEIIGRAGWLSGNSLAITMERISGSRLAESFDGDPELAPLLHIE
jgi:type IV pilus assembly protein PilY1